MVTMMKTVALVKRSQFTKWEDTTKIIEILESLDKLKVPKSKKLKICTNINFAIPELHPFNMFLKYQRMEGVICIMVDLSK